MKCFGFVIFVSSPFPSNGQQRNSAKETNHERNEKMKEFERIYASTDFLNKHASVAFDIVLCTYMPTLILLYIQRRKKNIHLSTYYM